ncbi:TPA: hypothetical protein VQK65_002181, partial [Streptococcus pneumoniae]|nr:hypothetical protein [Streptococcus pneumoniae]
SLKNGRGADFNPYPLFTAYLRAMAANDDRLGLICCGLGPFNPAQLPVCRETDNRQAI